jgi:3-methyladenine DNA glycosylase AlkC
MKAGEIERIYQQFRVPPTWELKVLFYADMRVGPFGVLSLEERLAEVLARSKNKYKNVNELVSACKRIEVEISENIDIAIGDLALPLDNC